MGHAFAERQGEALVDDRLVEAQGLDRDGGHVRRQLLGRILRCIPADDAAILAIIDGHDTTKAARSAEDAIVKDADKLWRFGVTGVSVACDWFKMTPRQYADRLEHQVAQLETEAGRDWAAQELRATRVTLKLNVI